MFFFLSRYMQEVLGYSALDAGLSYLPLAIVIIVSAGGAAQLVTRLGFKTVLATGLVLITIALLWFSQVPTDGTYLGHLLAPDADRRGRSRLRVRARHDRRDGRHLDRPTPGLASGLINTSSRSAARSASPCSPRSRARARPI